MKLSYWLLVAAVVLVLPGCGRQSLVSAGGKTDGGSAVDRHDGLAGKDELQLDYSILLDDGGEGRRVNEKFHFRSGDRFQIQLRPGFAAHVYVFNRGQVQAACSVLFPQAEGGPQNPIPAGRTITLPGGGKWLTMDNHPGAEYLTMVASPIAVPDLDTPEQKIPRDECEQRLSFVERNFRPASSRSFDDKDWTKLFAARGAKTAFVVRFPLDHR